MTLETVSSFVCWMLNLTDGVLAFARKSLKDSFGSFIVFANFGAISW
jgi:hypothetical protein